MIFMWFRLFRREVELARDAELGILPEEAEAETAEAAADSATPVTAREPSSTSGV